MDKKISSTNEMQVLEVKVAGNTFGINISKILKLTRYRAVQPVSHPRIEGTIHLGNKVFTVVDLAKYLDLPASEDPEHDLLIIMEFKQMGMAFHIHQADTISRISWEAIEKPDSQLYGDKDNMVIGIAKLEDRVITLIDLEWIMHEIAAALSTQAHSGETADPGNKNKESGLIGQVLFCE